MLGIILGDTNSKKTVVYLHHSDTVDVEDYGQLAELAYSPYELMEFYKEGKVHLSADAKNDLDSEDWIFGRGLTDMKSGGAMQMALLEEYIEEEQFEGNILVIAVPDEENSSAGMRSAGYLFKDLHEKYRLEYTLLLDSEPHERLDAFKSTIYDGSIGKLCRLLL